MLVGQIVSFFLSHIYIYITKNQCFNTVIQSNAIRESASSVVLIQLRVFTVVTYYTMSA